jgi:tektin-3
MSYFAQSPLVRRSITPVTPMGEANSMMPIGMRSSMGQPKAIYNNARNTMYSRYTTQDWMHSNNANYGLSEKERSASERIRTDVWQTVKYADQLTRKRQTSNTKLLGERVTDIGFWKDELANEMRAMDSEMENLQEHKRVLEKAFVDTRGPSAIADECLMQREKRLGIDQVNDEVERSLSKEVEVIKQCQEKMKNLIEKSHVQLKMDKAAQHACDKDAKDKYHAHNVDDKQHRLRNTSGSIGFYPGVESIDNTMTIPDSWVRFTQENIARSQRERELSEKLRGEIDTCLRNCANAMWSQFSIVNNAFGARVQETTDAKNKLQAHLQRTVNEIHDMEKAIQLIKKAIHDKEGPMKVAQTRLEERTHRIGVELCNDPVMKGLKKEVDEIRESVQLLKTKLKDAETSMARLRKSKAILEQDISIKENSLSIDSKICMGLRKSIPMDRNIGPIFQMPVSVY